MDRPSEHRQDGSNALRRAEALLRLLESLKRRLDDGCILDNNRRLIAFYPRWRRLVEDLVSSLYRERADEIMGLLGKPAQLEGLLTEDVRRSVLPTGYLEQVGAIAETLNRHHRVLTQIKDVLLDAQQGGATDGSSAAPPS